MTARNSRTIMGKLVEKAIYPNGYVRITVKFGVMPWQKVDVESTIPAVVNWIRSIDKGETLTVQYDTHTNAIISIQ